MQLLRVVKAVETAESPHEIDFLYFELAAKPL